MENLSGYARVLARIRVKQQVNKPFLGKPYLKYGQCSGIWGYFFQLGGILGAKHSGNLVAFGHAFLGVTGPSGVVKKYFTEVATDLATDSVSDSMTFADYVTGEFIRRAGYTGYTGDHARFFIQHGMHKISPETAEELAWQYAERGAALGGTSPNMLRKMFERTHAVVPKEQWDRARAAGLNIPPEQDLMSYEETEEGENETFMDYCREFFPDLYSILGRLT